VQALADSILRYVTAHPSACDTADGICDWWVRRQRYDDAKGAVTEALDLLIRRGDIESRVGPDGQVLFSAHRDPTS
jgi:hypothetical protein